VPTGAQDPARPPSSGEGLEALLQIMPDRAKPGIRALLSGVDPALQNGDTSFFGKTGSHRSPVCSTSPRSTTDRVISS